MSIHFHTSSGRGLSKGVAVVSQTTFPATCDSPEKLQKLDPPLSLPEILMVERCEDRLPRPATGFLVRAELRMTPDKGIGVFAAQFIPVKTRIYESEPISYSEEEASALLESLPTLEERKHWLEHAYGSQGKVCIDQDDSTMINHSDNPNMINELLSEHKHKVKNYSIAVRNIEEGEELTEDYRTYSLTPAYIRLCKKYGVCEVYEMESYSK